VTPKRWERAVPDQGWPEHTYRGGDHSSTATPLAATEALRMDMDYRGCGPIAGVGERRTSEAPPRTA
jgi:hypothetical protein